ncbi:hypothetical protein BO71DRAFT_87544 [Aspergillus ellipticus CBS 707.79]|uniref:Uncharacterized protein n=1 Tax=Aspergillus ellipticus CBS 707.79 TaxID=1448320 RepID=A0A319EGU1_9EURO|nr:hypothetical protein BO71DRAFT_87544 [Aspergillus ellipticus CBS 707.79]
MAVLAMQPRDSRHGGQPLSHSRSTAFRDGGWAIGLQLLTARPGRIHPRMDEGQAKGNTADRSAYHRRQACSGSGSPGTHVQVVVAVWLHRPGPSRDPPGSVSRARPVCSVCASYPSCGQVGPMGSGSVYAVGGVDRYSVSPSVGCIVLRLTGYIQYRTVSADHQRPPSPRSRSPVDLPESGTQKHRPCRNLTRLRHVMTVMPPPVSHRQPIVTRAPSCGGPGTLSPVKEGTEWGTDRR